MTAAWSCPAVIGVGSVPLPVRFLSDAELARLSSWPDEIAAEDLVTFFTLSPDDLGWLRSIRHAQRFLSAFSGISPHFRPRRHLLSAADYRQVMADRFAVWNEITGATTTAAA